MKLAINFLFLGMKMSCWMSRSETHTISRSVLFVCGYLGAVNFGLMRNFNVASFDIFEILLMLLVVVVVVIFWCMQFSPVSAVFLRLNIIKIFSEIFPRLCLNIYNCRKNSLGKWHLPRPTFLYILIKNINQ